MAWEARQRGGRYYTRSVKRNGRVSREYVGCGPAAELIAQMEALERERRDEERRAAREAEERRCALEAPVRQLCEAAELWAQVALVAAGYHRHDRGEWRRRRGS